MNNKVLRKFTIIFSIAAIAFYSAAQTFSQPDTSGIFIESVKKRLSSMSMVDEKGRQTKGLKFGDVCKIDSDFVSKTVFTAYGSAFVVSDAASAPTSCIYADELAVSRFQNSTKYSSAVIDGVTIELQEAAMRDLLTAISQARAQNLTISPLDGSIAARRSYADTVRIWNSRFHRALNFWTAKGRIKPADAEAAKAMATREQVEKVLEWEKQGMFFSTNMTKSILYATAPPGTSQHISMLAFDVVNYGNGRIRTILAENGWFQTIMTDLPHFTYLGRKESELPLLGLKKIKREGHTFWVPGI